ncbi:DMT family transporter [Luedemannella flava]
MPTTAMILAYVASFACLAQAVKGIEVGVAYAIWAGLGTALIVVIGATLLGESVSLPKVIGVLLVIAGVVILNLGGTHGTATNG